MKVLITRRGDIACVDTVDADLAQHRWYLNTNGYFMRYVGGGRAAQKQTTLHRQILERVSSPPSAAHYVDHINGEKWDNRRSNLRWCTPRQSSANQTRKPGNAGFKGVYRLKKYPHRYTAHLCQQYLGIFGSAEEAARAYDAAARQRHGEFARLNFQEALDG